MDESFIRMQMNPAGIRSLTAAFYRRVKTDDLIGAMYPPEDLAAAEERLGDYLCFRLLGETKYVEQRGHPRLRMRHAPFSIGAAERDRWLALMDGAMEECAVPEPAASALRSFFAQVADFMRNRPESA
jgi:hemoglobin